MQIKAQVKSIGAFTQELKKDGTGTYLALPVTFKIGENKRFVVVDQNTGQTEQRVYDEMIFNRFIGQAAQRVADLQLQQGEMVNIDVQFTINTQYNRTDVDVRNVARPQQQGAHQPGNSPW